MWRCQRLRIWRLEQSLHLVHWHSTREKKLAESSAEAELYGLCTSFKTARNFRLLIHETIATEAIMNMRCDNMAALAMND